MSKVFRPFERNFRQTAFEHRSLSILRLPQGLTQIPSQFSLIEDRFLSTYYVDSTVVGLIEEKLSDKFTALQELTRYGWK